MFSLCGISFLANRAQIQVKYPTKNKIVVERVIFSSLNFGKWVNVTQGKRTSKNAVFLKVSSTFRAQSHILDKKRKKIFQNFTQYMHFKFIRTRWISDDCQGKNLWIRCKRRLQWHQVFKSFCIDETILWNKMQRLQSCCLGIEINRIHEVEGQKDPNIFAPLRWSEVKFLYYNQDASN